MNAGIKVEICPQCGAPAALRANKCGYCEAEFIIISIASLDRFDKTGINKYISHYKSLLKDQPDSGELNLAMGICNLDLGLYDLAAKFFAKAIEALPDSADGYYYYSLAIVKGRKPKLLTFSEVKKIEEYLQAAIQIDSSKAKYHYFWLIIKHEFYMKNGLRINPPTVSDLIAQANSAQYDEQEIAKMMARVPITDPTLLSVINR
jgi:tetratricopeptide (TPR) repeat protein